jgi:hypothetical protein
MAAKKAHPDITPQELYELSTNMGNYLHVLRGEFAKKMTHPLIQPFFTAKSTALRNGFNLWLGKGGPAPGRDAAAARVARSLANGAANALGVWMLANKAITGMWPWEDERSELFKIAVPEGWQEHPLGQRLWPKEGQQAYISTDMFYPLVGRAARASGMTDAYNTVMKGGNAGQATEAATRGMRNAALDLATGPVPEAAWHTFGAEPYVIADDKAGGTKMLQYQPRSADLLAELGSGGEYDPKNIEPGLWRGVGRRATGTAIGLNPMIGDAAEDVHEAFVEDSGGQSEAGDISLRALAWMLRYATLGGIAGQRDVDAMKKRLAKEQ